MKKGGRLDALIAADDAEAKALVSTDILINSAGRTMNKPLIEMTVADWDDVMTMNARGNVLHAGQALKVMIDQRSLSVLSRRHWTSLT